MTWTEIGLNHLSGAQRTLNYEPRSSVSRAYYAVHVTLAEKLIARGFVPPTNQQTPGHAQQLKLIKKLFAKEGKNFAKTLKALVNRLYRRRIDADYLRTVTVDRRMALDCLIDAVSVLKSLERM